MIEINLNQPNTNTINFIINSLKLLPSFCPDNNNCTEFKEIVSKLVKKINTTNKIARASVIQDAIEKLDKWCSKQPTMPFYNRMLEIFPIYLELLDAHIKDQYNRIEIFYNRAASSIRNLYDEFALESNNNNKNEAIIANVKARLAYHN